MKKLFNLLFVIALVPAFLFTSCKEENTTVDEYKLLTEHLKANTRDFADVLNGWVKPGSGIAVNKTDYTVPDYYVMDFRLKADYDNGHIKGAVNVAMADLLAAATTAGKSKPILCVCYTGQIAARATGLLRLAGYTAYDLKWGMAGWHADFQGKWNNGTKQLNHANWVKTGAPTTNTEHALPKLNTGKTTGAEILQARLEATIANTSWSVSNTDVLANPANYWINNKWGQTVWDTYGHITGAYRIDEDLKLENMKFLDPTVTTLVTYCYTGQTSSISTAYLNVIGYNNAKSLSFGANGMIYDNMVNGDAAIKKSTWKGTESGSTNNFAYIKTDGTVVNPQ
jgi:rhodanese-related sulfurtransferase